MKFEFEQISYLNKFDFEKKINFEKNSNFNKFEI
jgi:hypothetical protein